MISANSLKIILIVLSILNIISSILTVVLLIASPCKILPFEKGTYINNYCIIRDIGMGFACLTVALTIVSVIVYIKRHKYIKLEKLEKLLYDDTYGTDM